MTDSESYTLGEIATRLCAEEDERARYQTARRIQNWGTAGLMRPIGEAHGGRGAHHRYDRHELCKAAVLLELHRYALPIRVLEMAAGLFDDARKPDDRLESVPAVRRTPGGLQRQQKLARQLRSAWLGEQTLFLILGQDAAGGLKATFGPAMAPVDGARSAIMLNLTEILSTLGKRKAIERRQE